MARFHRRIWRAALLDHELYEEVEADRRATPQAFAVVLLSALGTGVGALGNSGSEGVFWHTLIAVAGWYVWALVACAIGTRLLPAPGTSSNVGELLRTLGFSSAPGMLRVGMLVPQVGLGIFAVCTLWMLATMVVAVRQALDYPSTARAIAVCAIGMPVYVAPLVLSFLVLGPWPL